MPSLTVAYTDIARLGRWWEGSREATLRSHAERLLSFGGTLIVPTFNYDWCQTGRYDPKADPCQVGQLNEYIRTHHRGRRTLTPVFNFYVVGARIENMPEDAPAVDPFGPFSDFKWFIRQRARVVAYGARLRNASACHVNERDARVPYRHVKPFPGEIEGYGIHTLRYFVRKPTAVYDWDKVDALLAPVFTEAEPGVFVSTADAIYGCLAAALEADPFAFLAEPPKAVA